MDSVTLVLSLSLFAVLVLAVRITIDMEREKHVNADMEFHRRMKLQDERMLWTMICEIERRKKNES